MKAPCALTPYDEFTVALNKLERKYIRKPKFLPAYDCYGIARDKRAILHEHFAAIQASTVGQSFRTWLQDNGLTYLAKGTFAEVYLDVDLTYVVKVTTDDYLQYFNPKYVPHLKGCSSIAKVNKAYLKIRKIFLTHILYPLLISNDGKVCVQQYLGQGPEYDDKIIAYFNNQLRGLAIPGRIVDVTALGPFENLAWSEAENKAYIIDLY